jgi:asparagine synthase (glutamine-hydrolysing)
MHEAGGTTPKTFTVVFEEAGFSERAYARQVAHRYGTDHHELEFSESELLAQLPSSLAAMDQPTMDGVNTFAVARAVAAAGIKVALSGLGSDELFAGYPSFRRARWARFAATVPAAVRGSVAVGARHLLNNRYGKVWELLASDCKPSSVYHISRQLFAADEIDSLIPGRPHDPDERPSSRSDDDINEISRFELGGYMTDLLLRDTDFMSMASSLEVRVPFVDKMIVRHALGMPGRWKLAPSTPKPLLLDAMRGDVPGYVWNRRKMGFAFPLDRWMRFSLRGQIEETLNDTQLARAAGIMPEACVRVWRAFLDGSARWSKPWSLFVLLKWCERHQVSI